MKGNKVKKKKEINKNPASLFTGNKVLSQRGQQGHGRGKDLWRQQLKLLDGELSTDSSCHASALAKVGTCVVAV